MKLKFITIKNLIFFKNNLQSNKKIYSKINFKNFLQKNIKKISLILLLLVVTFLVFASFTTLYWRAQQQTAKLQETIEYLESKKHEVQNLQKKIYIKYPKIEANIQSVLKKINITNSNFETILINQTESKILLSVKDITSKQFIKLVFELENAFPTLIIEKIKVDFKVANKLTISLEILGLN